MSSLRRKIRRNMFFKDMNAKSKRIYNIERKDGTALKRVVNVIMTKEFLSSRGFHL